MGATFVGRDAGDSVHFEVAELLQKNAADVNYTHHLSGRKGRSTRQHAGKDSVLHGGFTWFKDGNER